MSFVSIRSKICSWLVVIDTEVNVVKEGKLMSLQEDHLMNNDITREPGVI